MCATIEVLPEANQPSSYPRTPFVAAGKGAHVSRASVQCQQYRNYFLLFFLCFLLSWEITELRVCFLVMRPEYIGIICRHQLINRRIKGKELAEGDAFWIFAEQEPPSAQGGSRGR